MGLWQEYQGVQAYVVEGIPHHLMDGLVPTEVATVTEWCLQARTAIQQIGERKHVPIVVGGTGLYIQALLDGYVPPAVSPQFSWRQEMSQKPLAELVAVLEACDPASAAQIDLKNPRRVLRALEVATFTGASFIAQQQKGESEYESLRLGLRVPRQELYERLERTIDRMFAEGWIEEVERLHAQGVPFDAPALTSLGYRDISLFLQGTIDRSRLRTQIIQATRQYAKRQETWFKRDRSIEWFDAAEPAFQRIQDWNVRSPKSG